jgi:hypothetical protein
VESEKLLEGSCPGMWASREEEDLQGDRNLPLCIWGGGKERERREPGQEVPVRLRGLKDQGGHLN